MRNLPVLLKEKCDAISETVAEVLSDPYVTELDVDEYIRAQLYYIEHVKNMPSKSSIAAAKKYNTTPCDFVEDLLYLHRYTIVELRRQAMQLGMEV